MTNQIVPQSGHNQEIVSSEQTERLKQAGQVANEYAAQSSFLDYRDGLTENTKRAHDKDLNSFESFLHDSGIATIENLNINPDSWQGVTFGLLEAFKRYLLKSSYAISTINRRLSTVRRYASLAFKAGVIDTTEHARIKTVTGYSGKQARNVDEKREQTRILNDKGQAVKKADNVQIGADIVGKLKDKHNLATPLGLRNRAMMYILLDHGFRASEVVDLKVSDINLAEGTMTFYRRKVDKTQTHTLTAGTLKALSDYMPSWLTGDMSLFTGVKRNGELTTKGITTRTVSRIVNELGKEHGIERLSAHDCRHSWATRAAKGGTSPFALQEAGGWNSLAMPRRYVDAQAVANEGVTLAS